MLHAAKYERLAEATGFPNLATVNDPQRLERLCGLCSTAAAHLVPGAPLRYRIAYSEYAEAAAYRLEHPEEIN